VALLNGKVAERAVRVMSAISTLCADNQANQLAIAKYGGIPPVIGWLSSPDPGAQKAAAFALLHLAKENTTTQVSLVNCLLMASDCSIWPRRIRRRRCSLPI
jgi:hypothetical protein